MGSPLRTSNSGRQPINDRREGKAFGGRTSVAQALAGAHMAVHAKAGIQQRFTRNDVRGTFRTDHERSGVGAALMNHALAAARAAGHGAVILLGDAPYYARFGFSGLKTGELSLPGPFERDRLLGLELREGALGGASGMIVADGALLPKTGTHRVKKTRLVSHAA